MSRALPPCHNSSRVVHISNMEHQMWISSKLCYTLGQRTSRTDLGQALVLWWSTRYTTWATASSSYEWPCVQGSPSKTNSHSRKRTVDDSRPGRTDATKKPIIAFPSFARLWPRFCIWVDLFTTKKYWIFFRIGPERRREAGMPTGVYYWIHPTRSILGTSSAKVTEWVSRQSLKRTMWCTLGLGVGILPEVSIVSIYPCVILVEA